MSKFVIECPQCGKYAEAKTGFFARKKIDCSCGYTINIRADKLAGRECPRCGNVVVFDQSKGEKLSARFVVSQSTLRPDKAKRRNFLAPSVVCDYAPAGQRRPTPAPFVTV